jgi:hypothetical protein
MDPPSPSSTISSASASDEVVPVVSFPNNPPLPVKPPIDSPTWYRDTKLYLEALKANIEADRQARALQGIYSIESHCNISGMQIPIDLWDQPGDGEFIKAEKKHRRTEYLKSLGVELEVWIFPKVTVIKGKKSSDRK